MVLRGPQRSSEVISGHQRYSEAIRGLQRSSEVIRGHQRYSKALGTRDAGARLELSGREMRPDW
jgi:hypothetical protein